MKLDIKTILTAVDTHTEGGPTRIISGGIPLLRGSTMKEKMVYFKKNLDDLRKFLMLEPRGHKGMFGAVLTEPINPQADAGVIFLTSSGYLSMCVHSAIGVTAASLETGIVPKPLNRRSFKLDTPAGLISLEPKYKGKRLESIAIQTNPAFVYSEESSLNVGLKNPIKVSIVFSSVFFLLLDVKQLHMKVDQNVLPELIMLGPRILEVANRTLEICHPENPEIRTIELALFYEEIDRQHAVNAVISRAGNLDASPCGAGTGAKMAYLFASGRLDLKEPYNNLSIHGTKFSGQLVKSINVGPYQGVVPQISGSAYITGMHHFILDKHDPLPTGF